MKETNTYCFPLTLEKHLQSIVQENDFVTDLYSVWRLLKKKMDDRLSDSRNIFVTYSLHDSSHSQSVIQAIERFLGNERISILSPTDTFMLLVCAYAHDYGMALTYDKIYHILESNKFKEYIEDKYKEIYSNGLDTEDKQIITNIRNYLFNSNRVPEIQDLYSSIMLVMQEYLRPNHWQGVVQIENDFRGIFEGNVKPRFINKTEGVVNICKCHGLSMNEVLELSPVADGMIGDLYHPRFIAAMLRLGDLLDFDNSRFPTWFVKEVSNNTSIIPELSKINYYKHESITHLLITPSIIEITAHCESQKNISGNKIANIVSNWVKWLEDECIDLTLHWNEIAPDNFGRPPGRVVKKIYLDGQKYNFSENQFQMQMSQERVMKLLVGTSIYSNKYVGIREMLQNAIDASLLQLWSDILNNKYLPYGLSKDSVMNSANESDPFDFKNLLENERYTILGNYNIQIEIIKELRTRKIYVVVKDRGIGIKAEEIKFIADLGSSKDANLRVQNIMKSMPAWLKPSGVFGIGLQSVFQLTDTIEFYSRQPNEREQAIIVHSYGKNRGIVDSYTIPPQNDDEPYYDNAVPGTNVKIEIDPEKLKDQSGPLTNVGFQYYDLSFDDYDDLDTVFAEISSACQKTLKESPYDYFDVNLIEIIKDENDKVISKEEKRVRRRSYFYPRKKYAPPAKISTGNRTPFGDTYFSFVAKKETFPYAYETFGMCYWDIEECRIYHLKIRPCKMKNVGENIEISFPEPIPDLYSIKYKFNTISNVESLYDINRLHASFVNMDVQIMDDEPTKYLNIDRDRLKKGAIKEASLCKKRTILVNKWCKWLTKNKKSFKNDIGTLISLHFLFFQEVPLKDFNKFYDSYKAYFQNKNFVVGNNGHSFLKFFDLENHFITSTHTINNPSYMSKKIVHHLPHRMVFIDNISEKDNTLCYNFSLRGPGSETIGINMDSKARKDDYIQMILSETSKKPQWMKMIRGLFKPDNDFSHLIIDHYPYTFSRGGNFAGEFGYIIERYILSPFDRASIKLISTLCKKGSNNLDSDINNCIDYIKGSSQFKKCVTYILKERYDSNSEMFEIIQTEYLTFVKNVINTLYLNKIHLGYDKATPIKK
ncbi:MAG: hypothetical protein Q4D45_01670 [Lachnospiraceae bacterium]|nr:hypothetical protein [Lachnospiraceae bacterium]